PLKTLYRWRKEDAWNSLLKQQKTTNQDEGSFEDKLKRKLITALDNPRIQPSKWKELFDGFNLLSKGKIVPMETVCSECKKLTQISGQELDEMIQDKLQFINRQLKLPPSSFSLDGEPNEVEAEPAIDEPNCEAEPQKEQPSSEDDPFKKAWWN